MLGLALNHFSATLHVGGIPKLYFDWHPLVQLLHNFLLVQMCKMLTSKSMIWQFIYSTYLMSEREILTFGGTIVHFNKIKECIFKLCSLFCCEAFALFYCYRAKTLSTRTRVTLYLYNKEYAYIHTCINVSVWPRGYLCLWYVTLGETKRPPVHILQPNNSVCVCVCGFLHLCPIDRFWSLSDNTTVFYWRNQMSPVLICHPPTN